MSGSAQSHQFYLGWLQERMMLMSHLQVLDDTAGVRRPQTYISHEHTGSVLCLDANIPQSQCLTTHITFRDKHSPDKPACSTSLLPDSQKTANLIIYSKLDAECIYLSRTLPDAADHSGLDVSWMECVLHSICLS